MVRFISYVYCIIIIFYLHHEKYVFITVLKLIYLNVIIFVNGYMYSMGVIYYRQWFNDNYCKTNVLLIAMNTRGKSELNDKTPCTSAVELKRSKLFIIKCIIFTRRVLYKSNYIIQFCFVFFFHVNSVQPSIKFYKTYTVR